MRTLILTALLLLSSNLPTTAHATSQLLLSDVELAEGATAVVRATVHAQKVVLHPEWHRPMTHSEVIVKEVLFGDAPQTIIVEQMGGAWNGETLHVSGDAQMKTGDDVVLFLAKRDGHWYLSAMEQSKFSVEPSLDGLMLHRDFTSGFYLRGPDGSLKKVETIDKSDVRLEDLRMLLKDLEVNR